MSKLTDLTRKLKEVLQLDRPELDFGIYRIVNQRATKISDFLENRLPQVVRDALGRDSAALAEKLEEELRAKCELYRADGLDPDSIPKVRELRQQIEDAKQETVDYENDVYGHLLRFFSRYYDNGDFISQRRYSSPHSDARYAIPYNGEEVKLVWANMDQYYIKSGEHFTNYAFALDDGRTVEFRLVAADTAKDNRRDNDQTRCFVLATSRPETRRDADGEEIEEVIQPVEASADRLVIRFDYKPMPKKTKQADLNSEAVTALLADPTILAEWSALAERRPTEKNPARTLLEKQLTDYTARNTADYFIHKDLGGFLNRELDHYIKSEVMDLDDIQHVGAAESIQKQLRMIQCLRTVAQQLIAFMAQLEDFQKKLWLKKKFVVETNYCITLDRVPEALYPDIAANNAQRQEWVRLFAIDEIEGDMVTPAYSEPLTVEFLKANDKLVLDTAFFPPEFKTRLLTSIDDIDAQTAGLLVHSENFQALNVLRMRYRREVAGIFIDPPYNTGVDGFPYKDSYQHSSWLSMMEHRLRLGRDLLQTDGLAFCTIDFVEVSLLRVLFDDVFGSENFMADVAWEKRYTRSNNAKRFYSLKDTVLCYRASESLSVVREARTEKSKSNYSNPDNDPRGDWISSSYVNPASKQERPNLVYSIVNPVTGAAVEHPTHAWKYDRSTHAEHVAGNRLYWGIDGGHEYPRLKSFLSEASEGMVPVDVWRHDDTGTTDDGGKAVKGMFGSDVFSNPKPPKLVCRAMGILPPSTEASVIADYFAGSGTTGHAIISLNRESGGTRRYLLVEMGECFDAVLKPRMGKVIYSADWRDGKPTSRDTGVSHCFKYIRLESYEDTLNNLALEDRSADLPQLPKSVRDDYLLRYSLDVETRGSLLNTEMFRSPFGHELNIARGSSGGSVRTTVDLVETFNYLIGLKVAKMVSRFEKEGYLYLEGETVAGERTLVLWRDCDRVGYEELTRICEHLDINPRDFEYDVVYVNGDHNIPQAVAREEQDGELTLTLKLRQIEHEFLKRMFDVEGV